MAFRRISQGERYRLFSSNDKTELPSLAKFLLRCDNNGIQKRELHTSAANRSMFESFFNYEAKRRDYIQQFELKYGSNPHQNTPGGSCVYSINNTSYSDYVNGTSAKGQSPFKIVNGIPSYINMLDAINSWQLVTDLHKRFDTHAAASFKHTSPTGAAIVLRSDLKKYPREAEYDHFVVAYKKARGGDPMSSFGDFIAINGLVTEHLARYISPFVSDGIVAKDFMPEAVEILKKKKKGSYVMIQAEINTQIPDIEYREIYGIAISQPVNRESIEWGDFKSDNIITDRKTLTKYERENLMLANMCLKYAQSNNVALALDGQLIGISAGQQSRIHSTRLAVKKAEVWLMCNDRDIEEYFNPITHKMKYQDAINLKIRFIEDFLGDELTLNETKMYRSKYGINDQFRLDLYAVIKHIYYNKDPPHGISLASDAFIPFRDNIDCGSKVSVTAISQPGGSVRDGDVLDACNDYGIAMVCHNKRMFTH